MIEETTPQSDLDAAFLDYLNRVDRDGEVDLDRFLEQYPRFTEPLRKLIETESQIEQMAGPSVEKLSEDDSTKSHVDAVQKETVIVAGGQTSGGQDDTGRALVGKHLGGYEILDVLGAGGMGVVYHARQIGMSRDVAFKMIRSGCLASESDVQRFYLEAQAAGRLKHHLIVKVYEVGEIEGHHFFSMEHIAGTTLSKYVRDRESSPHEIAEIMRQIAEAVHYAHEQGVLHRDLKPSNILVDSLGRPRITDFGLAKDMSSGAELTDSGSTLGTPSYMPPEQAQARRNEISIRSDVYSLGAILYALLTDRPPFRGDSLLETLNQVIDDEPVPPRSLNSQCPRDLEAICLKCLQKSPADRYDSAQHLAEDLSRFLSGDPVTARRTRLYNRTWSWLRNVPLIAAAMGRKSSRATIGHLIFQWSAVLLLILVVGGLIFIPGWIESQRVAVPELSTGNPGGSYDRIGKTLAEEFRKTTGREMPLRQSAGAVESRTRLLNGDVDLAFLQGNTQELKQLEVLAPLYYEVVLIIVRRDAQIDAITDLRRKNIALGQIGSGMRISSRELLKYYGIKESELEDIDRTYSELSEDPKLQGAIVTIKLNDSVLGDLLQSGQFKLMPLPDQSDIGSFRPMKLNENDLPGNVIPPGGMFVPATFAILAVRQQSPDSFVTDCLNALYGEGGVASQSHEIFSLEDASTKFTYLNYHQAAHQYFSKARQEEVPP